MSVRRAGVAVFTRRTRRNSVSVQDPSSALLRDAAAFDPGGATESHAEVLRRFVRHDLPILRPRLLDLSGRLLGPHAAATPPPGGHDR